MSTAVPPLVDAAARELAAADLSTTYIVEAAAGTGKTTLLVSRILTIIRETLTTSAQIVAITFTEKAAAELKQRVREALEQAAAAGEEGAVRCAAALRDIDALSVSTIHSFCAELLRQRPVEAGVDPGFVVADETASAALIDEAWHEWLLTELNADAPAAARFLGLGLPLTAPNHAASLRSLFNTLWINRDDLQSLHVAAPDLRELQDHLDRLAADAEAACARLQDCRDPQDTLARQILTVQDWLAQRPASDLRAQWDWLANPPHLDGKSKGRKDNWDAVALTASREFLFNRFKTAGNVAMQRIISYWAAPLIEWLKAGVEFVWRRLRDRGLLDFQDLLICARAMLRDSGPARDYFKQRYAYVLVDEFQDTDPLQAEIVFFLCEKNTQHAADWRGVALEYGKLFIVGDPKQSIYRFRRADLDMYGAVRALVEAQGRCLPIRVNFRSDAALISEVNAIFTPWMTGAVDGRYEPEYVPMEPHRTAAVATSRAILLPPPPGFDSRRSAADIAAAEAACIAEYIAEQRAAAADFAYRDIGILYPVSTHLERLEEALKARAIPYQVAGERALGTRIEITSLHTVLSAVDNPLNELAVAGALRSPYFGCSDEELLTHRMGGGSFDYTGAESAVPHLRAAFTVLRDLHARRAAVPPSELIADLFARTAGLHVFALKPRGERRVALLLRILDLARAMEQAGSRSLTRFVHWLGRLDELPAMDDDFALAGETDAVQLLTFHKAKGLEFPTVILFGIERNQQRRHRAELVDRNAGSVEFKFAGLQTAGYESALMDDQRRERAETARLLYVAFTRARERLVLPLYWCKGAAKPDQQWFLEILSAYVPLTTDGLLDVSRGGFVLHDTGAYDLTIRRDERLQLEPSAEDSGDSNARAQWQIRRDQAAAGLNRAARFRRPSAHASAPPPAAASPTASPFALTFGSFVHRALERIALPDGDDLDVVLAEAAGEFAPSQEHVAEARGLIARVLRCPLLRERIAAARRVFRELHFLQEADGVLTEGSMDLVLIGGDAATIVDYKTDAVPDAAVAARTEFYRDQARDYAAALERIARVRVDEVWLYFLRPDRVVRLPRHELLP